MIAKKLGVSSSGGYEMLAQDGWKLVHQRYRKAMGERAWRKKLYIPAHSAVESQAFYKGMGRVEVKKYSKEHIEKELCDCQLECE